MSGASMAKLPIVAAAVGALAVAGAAASQSLAASGASAVLAPGPGPVARAQPEPLEPGLALLAATVAYASEPFAERLRIYVGARPWEGRSESAVVRYDPLGRRLRLELGAIEAYLADGTMAVIRRDNPRDVFVREYHPPLTMEKLQALLPPVPAPGLALTLDENLDRLAPYARVRQWRRAERDPTSGITTIEGVLADGGAITVHLERSDRVGDVMIQLGEDRWLSIQAGPVAPGDPGVWAIDPAGRARVDSLAALAPARPLRAGDAAPELFLLDEEDQPWRLHEALEQAPGPLALLLIRAGDAEGMAAARSAIAMLGARTDVAVAAAMIYIMREWSPESARADLAVLVEAGAARALWSVSPHRTIDGVTPEPAVLLLVAPDGTVLDVLALPGPGAEDLRAAIDEALAPEGEGGG